MCVDAEVLMHGMDAARDRRPILNQPQGPGGCIFVDAEVRWGMDAPHATA
jgi:hypothetical protein